jgi:hypothetical protein
MNFKMLQNLDKKISGDHLNILCSSTKVLWRKYISCSMCKKEKKCHINNNFIALKFVFFYIGQKNFFSRNLMSQHKISRCILKYFFPNFKTF